MALVDYSSDDNEEDETQPDVLTASAADTSSTQKTLPRPSRPPPPPLPRAFHDLYAASVRTAPADLPALHQGRVRAIPHVDGHWPSHLYTEWFPAAADHARLTALLRAVEGALPAHADAADAADAAAPLHSLLTSDLGAPLPLHISLSRPFVLPTAAKAAFLDGLTQSLAAASVRPFDVAFAGLAWHRSPDAARAFLVLRVTTTLPTAPPSATYNQPLLTLLARCNALVAAAGQPVLYADGHQSGTAATAFHMSIAWSLAAAHTVTDPAWTRATEAVFAAWQAADPAHRALRVRIDSVKAKIGNVVTDLPLGRVGRRGGSGGLLS